MTGTLSTPLARAKVLMGDEKATAVVLFSSRLLPCTFRTGDLGRAGVPYIVDLR